MNLGLVLILMKNKPCDIRLLRYSRYKRVMVGLEQPLGGSMTKVLNWIRIELSEHVLSYSDKVLLWTYISLAWMEKQESGINKHAQVIQAKHNLHVTFLCFTVTSTAAFCHPLRSTNLQGTVGILKTCGHHRHFDFVITVHHALLASKC